MLTSLDKLNSQMFRRELHTEFRVIGGPQPVTLELVEVQDQEGSLPLQVKSGSAGGSQEMELFSLHFRGPYTPRLGQQIHRLEHEKLGAFDIFLTPISAEPQAGTEYEVVFHRFRQRS
jgi:hypothetical protein